LPILRESVRDPPAFRSAPSRSRSQARYLEERGRTFNQAAGRTATPPFERPDGRRVSRRDDLERREDSRRSTRMFFFFSNQVGLVGSLLVSAVLTLVLLAFCNVI